eukprot:jgi/Mesvir1/16757/Mv15130-RA.2
MALQACARQLLLCPLEPVVARRNANRIVYGKRPGVLKSSTGKPLLGRGSSWWSSATYSRPSHIFQKCITRSALAEAKSASGEWWKEGADLFIACHTISDFQREVLEAPEGKLVVVDFYAPWCHGCEGLYPILCEVIRNRKGKFKCVKVNTDELKTYIKETLGVRGLPYMQVYRGGYGLIGSFQPVKSRVGQIAKNLDLVLKNPKGYYKSDPNGYLIPAEPPSEAEVKAIKEAVSKLSDQSSSVFSHLAQMAGVKSSAPPPPPWAAQAKADEAAGRGVMQATGRAPAGTAAVAAKTDLKAEFLATHGAQYGYQAALGNLTFDEFYAAEVGTRLGPNEHYLDYTGSSLYCNSTLDAAFKDLKSAVFGNPHSANPSSARTDQRVADMRMRILRFFNANPDDYQVIFTDSATGALKLVGESFPWSPTSEYRYLKENHMSVLGMRGYAIEKGASFRALDEALVDAWAAGRPVQGLDDGNGEAGSYSLFAFPLEENFAGVKYPQRWVDAIRRRKTRNGGSWKVLVDAAAYVPTQPLDLSAVPADFVTISFYKMFGYPTGVGCLLVRTEDAELLNKVFWGGGTVALAAASSNFHVLKCNPYERMEDGTVPFLDIISLEHGFRAIERLGGIRAVQAHVAALTHWLADHMRALRHASGAPVIKLFGKHSAANRYVRGGTCI